MSARKLALIFLSLCLLGPASEAAGQSWITQSLVFPQIAIGGGWESDITIINQGAENARGTIRFFSSTGEPAPVLANGSGPSPQVDFELRWRKAAVFQLTGTNETLVGYAVVDQGQDSDNGSICGLVTFRYRVDGQVLLQLGVRASPLLSSSHVAYDNSAGNRTAMAILSRDRAPVDLYRYDELGSYLDRFQVNFSYFGVDQVSAFVDQLFPSARGKRGFLRTSSESGAHFLVLNQNNLILSTSDAFPAVIERDLEIHVEEASTWTVRLVQMGEFLYGIAQKQPGDSDTEFITGSFCDGSLRLTLNGQSVDEENGMTFLLVGKGDSLEQLNGSALLLPADGIVVQGTFSLTKPEKAQF